MSARRTAAEIINPSRRYRWSLLLWLMVNWGTAEPWPPGSLRTARHVVPACEERKTKKDTHSSHLVFHHFHTDLHAFPTDVADDLVLVPQLGQLGHDVGAHVEADLLRTVLLNRLSGGHGNPSTKAIKKSCDKRDAERMSSYIEHRRGDGTSHRVSSKGVEMKSFTEGSCNFWENPYTHTHKHTRERKYPHTFTQH